MIFFTGSQSILEASLDVEKLLWKFSENSRENTRDGVLFW